jgi:HD-GYP domain-containing protein (c-di-GMP phosphodiesterase class II)
MVCSSHADQDQELQVKVDFDIDNLSQDKRLNKLLKSVVTEVKLYAEDQIKHIKQLAQIGLALSIEKDINKLLEMIVDEARDLTSADAGTLYILCKEKQHLRFEIMQNDTMKTRMGGASGAEIALPDVPLYKEGNPNYSNVSSYVALTDETLNFPDVYEADGFDFTGPRNYDAATGYRSKSMLVIPLKNHENEIIGVLQLLNAQDPESGEVIAFSPEYVDLIASLASQAAVALTNTQLIQELKDLFYAFIKSIATAIDEKSPYTGGHINRVVDLTMMIAEKINQTDEEPFKDLNFSADEMEELRLATWMHDVGKITTPESVVDKPTKLHTIFDRLRLIETRFQLIAQTIENHYLHQKNKLWQTENNTPERLKMLDEELNQNIRILNQELDFIKTCIDSERFMMDDDIAKIKEIGNKTYSLSGRAYPYLTENEIKNLCIRKGTLTAEERMVIENHATMTLKILQQLPFPWRLARVPEYAGGHHEKLDGSGYPRGLREKELPIQSRIMAVADIFEALTASDRPYKKPMLLSQAIEIMDKMKKNKQIDPDIYDLFIESGLYNEYANRAMAPSQMTEAESDVNRSELQIANQT